MNENYNTNTFRFHLDSPFFFNQIYEYLIDQQKVNVLEKTDLAGKKFDRNQFEIT
jgi:protease II